MNLSRCLFFFSWRPICSSSRNSTQRGYFFCLVRDVFIQLDLSKECIEVSVLFKQIQNGVSAALRHCGYWIDPSSEAVDGVPQRL
ncbi:hypothetical protein XELAEV_18021866mg [Xenopus laevis]|uniref:Uncharacterized protein n=1 Tax=Xenopus laevis TaxID=8355 RepID=A0A974D256_XENLA|nr:hypothetical protein XELAEV_18021866mg [Xenopus laevis]